MSRIKPKKAARRAAKANAWAAQIKAAIALGEREGYSRARREVIRWHNDYWRNPLDGKVRCFPPITHRSDLDSYEPQRSVFISARLFCSQVYVQHDLPSYLIDVNRKHAALQIAEGLLAEGFIHESTAVEEGRGTLIRWTCYAGKE